jgi:hypothetical protein
LIVLYLWLGARRPTAGYNKISPTAWEILAGTYDYPEDFDEATKELCQECATIRQTIPKDSINIKITKENHHADW